MSYLSVSLRDCKLRFDEFVGLMKSIALKCESIECLSLFTGKNDLYDVGIVGASHLIAVARAVKVLHLDFSQCKCYNVSEVISAIDTTALSQIAFDFSNNPIQSISSLAKMKVHSLSTFSLSMKYTIFHLTSTPSKDEAIELFFCDYLLIITFLENALLTRMDALILETSSFIIQGISFRCL